MKFISLAKIQDSDVRVVGGKALSLARMLRSGISVPGGLVVTTKHLDSFLDENNLKTKIEELLGLVDLEKNQSLNDSSSKIFDLILNGIISGELQKEIEKVFESLNTKFVAIRSSAVMEDGKENAWAGQFDSFLNAGEEKLVDYVKKCWASLFSPRALYYKITKGHMGDNWGMAVLIQKMVNADSSGVAFSVHPQTKNDKHIYIESSYGLGEAVVSGAVIPDHFVVHKDTLEVLDMSISQKDTALYRDINGETNWVDISPEKAMLQSLSLGQIKKLAESIKIIEKYFGMPCDIEWAYEAGSLHILQSRPITT